MKLERLFVAFAAFALSTLIVAGCAPTDSTDSSIPTDGGSDESTTDGGDENSTAENDAGDADSSESELEGKIEIDGSSTVYPISEAAAKQFMGKYSKVDVTVGVSGTGGGFKRFTKGETDISDASRPIKDSEFKLCREQSIDFIELPVAYDGLSIVINPKNEFVEQLTVDDLKKIFLAGGGAKTWKDVNEAWPKEEIKIYAPGKDSGTFDYFFEDVVNKDGKDAPRSEGVSFNEDDNALVDGVARDQFAIGFFGCSYYFENKEKVKAVKIVNPNGDAIAPTADTIESGEYAPFSRSLFIYVNVESLKSPAMKKFVEFYLDNAPELAETVKYVALPETLYDAAYTHYEDRISGTHFLTSEFEKRSGALEEIYTEENLLKVAE